MQQSTIRIQCGLSILEIGQLGNKKAREHSPAWTGLVESPVFVTFQAYLGKTVPAASAAVAVTQTAGAPYFGVPKMHSRLVLVQIVDASSVLVVASGRGSHSLAGYFH